MLSRPWWNSEAAGAADETAGTKEASPQLVMHMKMGVAGGNSAHVHCAGSGWGGVHDVFIVEYARKHSFGSQKFPQF